MTTVSRGGIDLPEKLDTFAADIEAEFATIGTPEAFQVLYDDTATGLGLNVQDALDNLYVITLAMGGNWKPPVATPGALPVGFDGDARVVIDDGDGFPAIYAHKAGTWYKVGDPDYVTATAAAMIAAAAVAAHVALGDPHTQYTPKTRLINTTAPLAGGGDLSADRTLTIGAATETATGVAEIATQAETNTGTDDTRFVTPLKLTAWAARGSPVGWGNGSVSATTTTRYLTLGFDPGTAPTARVAWVADAPGAIDLLRVLHDSAAGNGNAIVYTVRKNAVATALAVSLATGAVGQAVDAADSFTVVAGDVIDIEVTKAASVGASPANVSATFRFRPS
jgi:hypothetical protein